MIIISFDGVGLSFGSHILFDSLNTTLSSGQITMVTGHNGSGKSTFLQLAAKFIVPGAGKVIVTDDGTVLQKDPFRSRLAMVTPELKLYARLTVEENLRFLLGLRGIKLSVEEIPPLLERVGLKWEEIRNTFASKLSTGMGQRVKLAALLAADADVWILDEPCANLDASGLQIVLKEARQAASEGKLILWATNDSREEAAADAVIHLPWN
ncbi:MAG: ATP-binding cassette domain-containing protein [Selenomonadaceae bacterium]|nr:ATP-binding cassette domain-containing protein [Selenomonadaceae bacterium]